MLRSQRLATLTLVVLLTALSAPAADSLAPRAERLLDEVDATIRREFYDPRLRGVDWTAEVARARARLREVRDEGRMYGVVNALLATLHTSHTAIYGRSSPFYYFLASTFGRNSPGYARAFGNGGVRMPDIGALMETRPQGVFTTWILEDGPADRAGLKVGDRVVDVDGRAWADLDSFRDRMGRAVTLRVQRQAGGPFLEVRVVPRLINPQDAFLDASRASARVVERGGRRIGYYHVWAFTDSRIYEQFQEMLHGPLGNVDGLVLDIRDGIGGGYPELLYPFLADVPRVGFTDRRGRKYAVGGRWTKPVALLINERSRSSKELYAYAFKARGIATLVGTRTEGAVTAARAYFMRDASLLYVAVSAVDVDGQILEARGVSPDVPIDRPIPYAAGRDPQLDRALEVVRQALR